MRRRDMILAAGSVALAWRRPAGADETPHRVALILTGQTRSSPPGVAFDERMHELGYVEGAQPRASLPQRRRTCRAIAPDRGRTGRAATRGNRRGRPRSHVAGSACGDDIDPGCHGRDRLRPGGAHGYAASLARPGGNITGVFAQQIELAAKRLELLAEAVPAVKRIGVLSDEFSADQLRAVEATRRALASCSIPWSCTTRPTTSRRQL